MFINSFRARRFVSRFKGRVVRGAEDRQERLPGFSQEPLKSARILMVGAGGLGGEFLEGLARKGLGEVVVCDGDEVEASNLNRQHFFERQLHQNKAKALVENMTPHAVHGTRLEGWGLHFANLVDSGFVKMDEFDLVIVGVDNSECRVDVSRYYLNRCPVVFAAVDHYAEAALVSIQEVGKACFGCLQPGSLNAGRHECFTPAAKDPLKIAAGLVLYAVDTLLLPGPGRERNWTVQEIHLAGFKPSFTRQVNRNPECVLCGNPNAS